MFLTDQRQDASSPSPPSSPPTDGSYQTPVTESVTRLVPVPEEVQLPSPTTSEEEPIPVPPPRAPTPGCEVSGQCCWTRRKFDKTPGAGAVTNWHFSRSFRLIFLNIYEHYPLDLILSSSPHSFNPFRLLIQFTDKQKTRVLNPRRSRHNV